MTDDRGAAERTGGPSQHHESVRRSTSWWPVLAPAGMLLVGLLIGGVVVGVAGGDTPSAGPQPTHSPSVGEVTESPVSGATTVVVPNECLAAVDTVTDATEVIREGAGAIRDFQPKQLRSLLRKLEDLDQRARQQTQACRAVQAKQSDSEQ
jgi:hypothetical protein